MRYSLYFRLSLTMVVLEVYTHDLFNYNSYIILQIVIENLTKISCNRVYMLLYDLITKVVCIHY